MQAPRGWHQRGYLPHFDVPGIAQFVTVHLADSLPQAVLEEWKLMLRLGGKGAATKEARIRIEEALDQGHGECLLRESRFAEIVENAVLHFNTERYTLHSWVVMPNHLHALFTPLTAWSLSEIMHSWKSFTCRKINKARGTRGSIWQREYFDRYIRNEDHYRRAVAYIEENPVKAGLCTRPEDWRWGSARLRVKAAGEQQ